MQACQWYICIPFVGMIGAGIHASAIFDVDLSPSRLKRAPTPIVRPPKRGPARPSSRAFGGPRPQDFCILHQDPPLPAARTTAHAATSPTTPRCQSRLARAPASPNFGDAIPNSMKKIHLGAAVVGGGLLVVVGVAKAVEASGR